MDNKNLAPRDFVIWQQAIFEMIGDRAPTEAEWKMLREKHDSVYGAVISYDFFKKMEEDKRMALERQLKQAQSDEFSRMVRGSSTAKTAMPVYGNTSSTAGDMLAAHTVTSVI